MARAEAARLEATLVAPEGGAAASSGLHAVTGQMEPPAAMRQETQSEAAENVEKKVHLRPPPALLTETAIEDAASMSIC